MVSVAETYEHERLTTNWNSMDEEYWMEDTVSTLTKD